VHFEIREFRPAAGVDAMQSTAALDRRSLLSRVYSERHDARHSGPQVSRLVGGHEVKR